MFIFVFIETDVGKFHEADIKNVIQQLGSNDIIKLFRTLGLEQNFIDRKRNAQRANVEQQANRVLNDWIEVVQPTIGELLDALREAENTNAAEELEIEWGIGDQTGSYKLTMIHAFCICVCLLSILKFRNAIWL